MTTTMQTLVDEGFIIFTFTQINTQINKNGEEKKIPMGMPKWKDINENNYLDYCNSSHKGVALITGKMSGITVFDFDKMSEYDKMVNIYPEILNYRTIKTNKGVHLYCQYDEQIKTTTDALINYSNIDIRNDDAIVFCPPTKYNLKNGTNCCYDDMGGEILPVPQFILDNLKQNQIQEIQEVKQIQQTEQQIETNKNEQKDLKYIQDALEQGYLDNKSNGSYDDWRDVGFIIKHTSKSEEAFKIFDCFSRLNKQKYDSNYTRSFWNTIKQTSKKPLTIATLKKWVKEARQTNEKNINSNIRYVTNDEEASQYIFEDLKDNLISCKGRLFLLSNHIWINDLAEIDDYVLTFIMLSPIYLQSDTNFRATYAQNVSKAKQIREALYAKIRTLNDDNLLYVKFHTTTKNRLCFNDGVLDFLQQKFFTWDEIDFEYYSCNKINREYKSFFDNPNFESINEIKTKIFENMYGNKTDTALHFLSRALSGNNEDKNWATYLGNRDCGKGVQYEILEKGFEDYVKTFELGNLLYNRKTAGLENTDCSKKLYWLLDLEFTRLAISQEVPDPTSQLKCNSKMLKKIAGGGDTIVARRNYDRRDTHFNIDTTFYILGNNSLMLDNDDCREHLIEFNSVNQFKSEQEIENMKKKGVDEIEIKRYKIKDNSIKEKCKNLEWKNAIVYLIYQNYKKKPVEIQREETEEYNTLLGYIKEKYEITNNKDDLVLCTNLYDKLSEICQDKKKIENELLSYNIFKKKQTKGEYRLKWCFVGLILKEVEKEDV